MKEQEFEVGDVWMNKVLSTQYTIKKIDGDKVWVNDFKSWDRKFWILENCTLVSKASKQEVIGYELLKDLPGIPKGTIGKPQNGVNVYYAFGAGFNFSVNQELQDTAWFKPIYEAKDVIVKISGDREVILENKQAKPIGMGSMSFAEVGLLHYSLNQTITIGKSSVSIINATVKIDYQTFSKRDIDTMYQAIQTLK